MANNGPPKPLSQIIPRSPIGRSTHITHRLSPVGLTYRQSRQAAQPLASQSSKNYPHGHWLPSPCTPPAHRAMQV